MKTIIQLHFIFITCIFSGCNSANEDRYVVTSEFEDQEYIWLSWVESGFLGGEPFYYTALQAMKEITPFVKVRLFYGPQLNLDKAQLESRIYEKLLEHEIDTSRVSLFYNEIYFGAIQDPKPVFLRNGKGEFLLTDFRYQHPDEKSEAIDRNIAAQLKLPVISSEMYSEGGAWQTNGKGTMLLVEAVELDRNPKMTKAQIEAEYKRVLGVTHIIWRKKGPKEEEWGKLENGIYGIGTGGHIDEFCRFADANTILLAAVDKQESEQDEISKETYRRLEENHEILKAAKDQDGQPFNIIRIPAATLMAGKRAYGDLTEIEKYWFEDVTTDTVEFYLATSYTNFVIANGVVVTSKYWKEGLPDGIRQKDEQAKTALQQAFPNRKIVQIDCMPLHHDGGGLHCHSMNEPKRK